MEIPEDHFHSNGTHIPPRSEEHSGTDGVDISDQYLTTGQMADNGGAHAAESPVKSATPGYETLKNRTEQNVYDDVV